MPANGSRARGESVMHRVIDDSYRWERSSTCFSKECGFVASRSPVHRRSAPVPPSPPALLPRRPFPACPAPLPAQTTRPPTRGLKSFNAPPCRKSSGDPASPFRPRPRPPLTVNFVNYQRDACPAAHVLARFFTAAFTRNRSSSVKTRGLAFLEFTSWIFDKRSRPSRSVKFEERRISICQQIGILEKKWR